MSAISEARLRGKVEQGINRIVVAIIIEFLSVLGQRDFLQGSLIEIASAIPNSRFRHSRRLLARGLSHDS